MMSLDDLAAFFKCERDYARDTLVKQEGFPAMAPGSTRKFKRWVKQDVLRYVAGDRFPQ